jgi:hypothetical protein
MYIGQTVEALVNNGDWCDCQVIAIYRDTVTVAGEAEVQLAAQRGTRPLGICLPLSLIRAKKLANTP